MGNFWSNLDGLNVHFDTRYSGEQVNFGEGAGPSGAQKTLTIILNILDFTANTATYNGTTLVLPAGVIIKSVAAEVIVAAGAMSGTAPVLNFGKSGSAATDRLCSLTNAQVQAVGPTDVSATGPIGVFAANVPLAAATTVTVALSGTGPLVHATNRAGRVQVMVRYEDSLGAFG